MGKTISFTYDGTEYTLEYNRRALHMLDTKYKFSLNELEEMQVSKLPDLFYCAFLMHHASTVKRELTDEIWETMPDKGDLVAALGQMYMEVIESMMGEPAKNKATKWVVNG